MDISPPATDSFVITPVIGPISTHSGTHVFNPPMKTPPTISRARPPLPDSPISGLPIQFPAPIGQFNFPTFPSINVDHPGLQPNNNSMHSGMYKISHQTKQNKNNLLM